MKTEELQRVVEIIGAGRKFLCTAHQSPDGDALGSMLATGLGLRALGKHVAFYDADPAPARFAFLPGAHEIVTTPPREKFDATFVHDCGDARLLGDHFPSRNVTGTVVVLDHHASARPFGDVVVRDPSAAAVGVLVARLLRALGVALDLPIAEALWCSLVSDTGWFRYSSTDIETMELARDCVAAGVRPWDFARRSEEEAPVARTRLLGLVLDTLAIFEIAGGRRAGFLTLTDEMLSKAGAAPELAEGFVNYARALEGVEVGAMLTQLRHDRVRVSLRSKGGFDVGAVAMSLDGGGHRAAAGCTLAGTLDQAQARLLAALRA
jgi:phosphoesterase RecJ-like protein